MYFSLDGRQVENIVLLGFESLAATGNFFANILTGNTGANTIDGGANNDTVSGGSGADSLAGGIGDDLVLGGSGRDSIAGGNGLDRLRAEEARTSLRAVRMPMFLVFKRGLGLSLEPRRPRCHHRLRPFPRPDRRLRHRCGVATAGDQGFAFIGTTGFSAPGQIRMSQSGNDAVVEINLTGNAGAEMAITLAKRHHRPPPHAKISSSSVGKRRGARTGLTRIAAGEVEHGGEREEGDEEGEKEGTPRTGPIENEGEEGGRHRVEDELRRGDGADDEAVAVAAEEGERHDALGDGHEAVRCTVEQGEDESGGERCSPRRRRSRGPQERRPTAMRPRVMTQMR